MSDFNDKMKVDVFTIPVEDAVQLVLDNYDSEPNGKDPKKLINSRSVSMKPVNPEDLPKNFKPGRNLIEQNTGEMLGLGMLGQYFRTLDGCDYDIIVSLEDAWKPQGETVISDGALKKVGDKNRMVLQQVMAQDLVNKPTGNIEDEIIKNISDKNSRMANKEYPDKSGLLISVYSMQKNINIMKIIKRIDLTVFPSYFIIRYKLPELNEAKVLSLGGIAIPPDKIMHNQHFILERYENPY